MDNPITEIENNSMNPIWSDKGLIVTLRGESISATVGCFFIGALVPLCAGAVFGPQTWCLVIPATIFIVPSILMFSQAMILNKLYIEPGMVSHKQTWGWISYRSVRVSLDENTIISLTDTLPYYTNEINICDPGEKPKLRVGADGHEKEEFVWLIAQLNAAKAKNSEE